MPLPTRDLISTFRGVEPLHGAIGHVRDLLRSQLSVDVDNNFEPKYRVPNEKKGVVKELKALARTVDAKSPWTAGHSERVTALALEVARCLGLSQEALDDLHRGAFLHDVGKVGIPNRILDKPGPLDLEEYEVIKEHPRMGALILEPIAAYQQVIPIVLQHHERYDGKGYPDGLKGEAICLGARILTAADVFDAMLATRPYRDGLNLAEVIDYMKSGAGQHFHPQVVEALLYVIERDGQVAEMLNGRVLDEAVA